ncbi:hypothetical protein BKD26_38205 [Streptomyces sp. CB03238]|nr:hypothetical protein BKD26_38205 [Streptomyces sp. CB03238]
MPGSAGPSPSGRRRPGPGRAGGGGGSGIQSPSAARSATVRARGSRGGGSGESGPGPSTRRCAALTPAVSPAQRGGAARGAERPGGTAPRAHLGTGPDPHTPYRHELHTTLPGGTSPYRSNST